MVTILADNCQIQFFPISLCLEIRMLYEGFTNGEPKCECLSLSSGETGVHSSQLLFHTYLSGHILHMYYKQVIYIVVGQVSIQGLIKI